MDFFDTVAGRDFTAITIPMLVKELEKLNSKKKVQTFTSCERSQIKEVILGEAEEGYSYVDCVDIGEGNVLLVFEKEEC